MQIIEQYHEILSIPEGLLETIERVGRTCYKSESRITPGSAEKFVKMLIERGHHAMIEFGDIIVKFVTNRGVTHELVRHRLCSFAQESTRYVNYGGKGFSFICPAWEKFSEMPSEFDYPYELRANIRNHPFILAAFESVRHYTELIACGWRPEQAREVLPNSLKTELVIKANIREWRHIFTLRCAKAAHPQMRALMIPCLKEFKQRVPVVFDDIK